MVELHHVVDLSSLSTDKGGGDFENKSFYSVREPVLPLRFTLDGYH